MFAILARRDDLLILSFVIVMTAIFYLIILLIFRKVPGRIYLDRNGKPYLIVKLIYIFIIISFTVILFIRSINIYNYMTKGIKFETNIIETEIKRRWLRGKNDNFLIIYCNYSINNNNYIGIYNVYDKNQRLKYTVGKKITILINEKDFSKSILYE